MSAEAGGFAPIRPEILRRYYEATYGVPGHPDEAFAGATFEEYLDLMRTTFPRLSRHLAAKRSPGGAFKHLAEGFKAEAEEAERQERARQAPRTAAVSISTRPSVDLAGDIADTGAESLLLHSIKDVTGISALARLPKLRSLKFVLCGTSEARTGNGAGYGSADASAKAPASALEELEINECTQALLERVLPATDARAVRIYHLDAPVFDCSLLKGHRRAREIAVPWGFAVGMRALRDFALEGAFFNDFLPDDAFFAALSGWAPTLAHLRIAPTRPFGPDRLPRLPRLVRLAVPAYPDLKEEWIGYALAHPRVRFQFPAPASPPAPEKAPVAKVGEIHRGLAILEVGKGSKRWFEIWADLSDIPGPLAGYGNHALRDRLESWTKARKLKAGFASESDGMMIRAAKAETVKACLDAVLDGKL